MSSCTQRVCRIGRRLFGISVLAATGSTISVAATVRYVDLNNTSPTPPYTNWSAAATGIQDAVDTADAGDEIVVTNGTYASGGRAVGTNVLHNRVAVDKPLTVRSVNGPAVTVIHGYQVPGAPNGDGAVRCVFLANGAILIGFTLTNGATRNSGDLGLEQNGGGVCCESASAGVSNCVLTGNRANYSGGAAYNGTLNTCTLSDNSAEFGGGASGGTLNNCTLSANSAYQGGGVYEQDSSPCTLNNCTLTGNSTSYGGGGASGGTLNNCIVYFNTATNEANYYQNQYGGVLKYCCTTPLPTCGFGNITNEPAFVDLAGGNLRLQSDSPCINAGNNADVTSTTDLDGRPRIVGSTVDIGTYEFPSPASIISYAWLQQYGLPTDGSADSVDSDGDTLNNWQEWICGTDPTNAASYLHVTILSNSPPMAVTFSSSAARLYTLLCCTNLTPSCIGTPVPGQTDMPGSGGVLTLTDTNPPTPAFYRVSVRFR